ncbi:MAG: SRPBCC family protein [Halieaceae bacterium]|jgi:hypothetical protein|nr:SRPBCC family protein [Halieaceae bacterium]
MAQIDYQRDLNFPASRVWAVLEDFGNMEWSGGIDRVELIGEGIGMTRRLHINGMDPIDEVLQSRDAATMSFSYTIPQGLPLPVTDYLASARVEALDDDSCRVFYRCECQPVDPSLPHADLEAMIHGTYSMLLDMVEAHLSDKAE